MLNLPIAMLKAFFSLIIIFQELTLALTAPQAGEILRGDVSIQGRLDSPNFASAELAFTYNESASDPAATWFTLQTFSQPIFDSTLTVWDTTTVTDGDYALRLRVYLLDGSFQDVLVPDLTIRNYTPNPTAIPIDTPTAAPTLPSFSQFNADPSSSTSAEPTAIISYPTATPLPPNPASLEIDAILTTFGKSALILLGIFFVISLLLRLRKNT
jgi:hypothetical protein